MQKLAEICIKRPVFASVIILILVVVGAAGFRNLGVDRFPKVDFPTITVTTDAARRFARIHRDRGLAAHRRSRQLDFGHRRFALLFQRGRLATVAVTFTLDKDVDVAAQEVRDKVNRVLNQLPQDAEQPVIQKQDTDATPIMGIALTGKK